MLKFEYSSLINAPVDIVWNFHERKDILKLLTPPWQPVQIVRREGGLKVGAITEFRIFLGLIPVTWIARHIACEPYQLFTDQQIQGPMESWIHRHQFSSQNGQTRLTDYITYELPGGLLAELLLGWWVNSRLQDMFHYRHLVTKQECEKLANYQYN
ncbi:SRPBCC family protein [Gloeothece verrucosa]|uniref:Cyclase/dehydrase n=1 Tax=Gloeothece verrucosa (strain PCC 7822) TaxID=497965 RepID=E0U9W7_GLOV7|nr:SRPBCC family protein [Gloeothece verrucosa]ADN15037.1 cyclase/dehydrase [Gloeothece verrucosa PCC 7822]